MYKLNEEKMFHDVADGIAVVINFKSGVYYGFNLFGTAVLDSLLAGAGKEEIICATKRIQGCPDNIEVTINQFVNSLLEKEIIIISEGKTIEATITEECLKEGFIPEIEEYSEVQDLILADPIHEVDPNQGWPTLK